MLGNYKCNEETESSIRYADGVSRWVNEREGEGGKQNNCPP